MKKLQSTYHLFVVIIVSCIFLFSGCAQESVSYAPDRGYEVIYTPFGSTTPIRTYSGDLDDYGRLNGQVIEKDGFGGTRSGTYINGKKNGQFVYTDKKSVTFKSGCYDQGIIIGMDCDAPDAFETLKINQYATTTADLNQTSQLINKQLYWKYPWLPVELELSTDYWQNKFNDFLDDLIKTIQEYPDVNQDNYQKAYTDSFDTFRTGPKYDTYGTLVGRIKNIVDVEMALKGKNHELHMACIDRNRHRPSTTFQFLITKYPEFQQRTSKILDTNALQTYLNALDAQMDWYGTFDQSDPLLTQKIDFRMNTVSGNMYYDSSHRYIETSDIIKSDAENFTYPADPIRQTIKSVLFPSMNEKTSRILDWAESIYPELMQRMGRVFYDIEGLYARYYPLSGIYAIGYQDILWLYQPSVNPDFVNLGTLDVWIMYAENAGY
jgi:hypothetical protein